MCHQTHAASKIVLISTVHWCDKTQLPGWTLVQPAKKIRGSLLSSYWENNEQILVQCCEDARGESALRVFPRGNTMNRSFLLRRVDGHKGRCFN